MEKIIPDENKPGPMVKRSVFIFFLYSIAAHISYSQPDDSLRVSQDSLSMSQDSISVSEIDTSEYFPGDHGFNLIVASSKGYDIEVLRLLNKGADINAQTTEGVTALMYAVQNGHENVVKILLLNGADPDLKPYNDPPALIVAASNMAINGINLI